MQKKSYLETIRGKNGGLRLAKPPGEIKLGDVVRSKEVKLDVVDCSKPVFPLINNCKLKCILNEAKQSFLKTLDNYTIQDLNEESEIIKNLLHFSS